MDAKVHKKGSETGEALAQQQAPPDAACHKEPVCGDADFSGNILSEEMEKTIVESAISEMGEEDLDEAVRNFANLANSNFDEFLDDGLEAVAIPELPTLETLCPVPLEIATGTATETLEKSPQDTPAQQASAEDLEIVMLGSSSENAAPFVIKEEHVSDDEMMDTTVDHFQSNQPEAPQHEESLMPNLPADFGLKSFDWDEPEKEVTKVDAPSTFEFAIKIRSDLMKSQKQTQEEEEEKIEVKKEKELVIEKPEVEAEESNSTKASVRDSSDESDSASKVEKKKVKKKKKEKEKQKKLKPPVYPKPAAVRAGVRLVEHGTPAQWLVDAVRIMLRQKHIYSAQDMDTCLDQLTTLPCIVKLQQLTEAQIKEACKLKKKESSPPQNYTSPKVKVNRNEMLDMVLAKEEMWKDEAKQQKKDEELKKRKVEGKDKEKKKKRIRLLSSGDESDTDTKLVKTSKKVETEKEKSKSEKRKIETPEPVEEVPSEGERSRDSSISRGDERAKEKADQEKSLSRSDSRNEEQVKEKKEKDVSLERSDSRSEERKEKERKEKRQKEREQRDKEKEKEVKEKEKEFREKEKELREKEREKNKKQNKAEKSSDAKQNVEIPKPLQTPSFKIPKRAEPVKPKETKEFSILPTPPQDPRRFEKKIIVQKMPRVERKAITVERSAQTDPLSCLRNYSGPSVEDLMLLARQQIREAPIILARWSRNPPVATGDLVRFQREMQKSEADRKANKIDLEKRKDAERLKQKISMNDYKNRKYTPKPLSKLGHSERKHQEAHMRREHRLHEGSMTNGAKQSLANEETSQAVAQRIEDRKASSLSSRHRRSPSKSSHHIPPDGDNIDNEPLSYTPPINSPDAPPTPTQDELDLNSIVKTGSSFLAPSTLQPGGQTPGNISLDERLRSTPFIMQIAQNAVPLPVPHPNSSPLTQNSPRHSIFPMHSATPPQIGSDASGSPAVGNGPGFPYNSPTAFNVPQPVPPPAVLAPVPPPSKVNAWSATNLEVQDFDRHISGHHLPAHYRDTSVEVGFWNKIRDEYCIPEFLINRCIREMKGPPGCKVPRCPQLHELVPMSSNMHQLSSTKALECFLSIRQKQFVAYYQTCFEELLKKLVRSREPRLLLCLCYEVMFREDELGSYWWNRLIEALLQLSDVIEVENAFEVKRVLVYVMNHRCCTLMLRNDIARLSIRTFQHLPDVLNQLFKDRNFVAHKSIVEILIEHVLLNKEQPWVTLALEILIANVSETVWRCFKHGVIQDLALLCGEAERVSLYSKSGRTPPSATQTFSAPKPSKPVQLPPPPMQVVVQPPLPAQNPPLPPLNPPLPPPEAPAAPPPPPPVSLIPPPLPPSLLMTGVDPNELNRPYSPTEKADDELDDPIDLEYNPETVTKLCFGHDKPELIKDLYARMLRAAESNDLSRITSIVLRHPGDKLPRGRILYSVLKEKMLRPSQGFLKISTAANAKSNTQAALVQKFHILLGTVGINILLDLVDQDLMNDALAVYLTVKTMSQLSWENVTSYRDNPITLEQILLKSCKMCFRMGQAAEAFELLKRFNQTTGHRGSKDLLDVLELLIQNFVNEHRYKESLVLWTHARETKLKFCQTNNLSKELPKNTNSLMVRLLNSNDVDLVLQMWKEMRDFPQCLDKITTRAVVHRLCRFNLDFALDAYHAGRLNSAYPPQMTNNRQVKIFSYWTYEEVYVIMEDVLRRLENNMKGTDISDFSLNIMLEELPEPPSSTDTIEDVTMPFVENSLQSLQTRVDEALSKMNPSIVLNPTRGDLKNLRANPVSLRCHLVQRRIRAQHVRQQQQQQQKVMSQ
ncbi:uncharacterized protein LOC132194077 [Neocloeon triangulifer]|uniref:uncharacterized protein LOC132194077 n=1 Tax=Neocloeon triangulifer TaxID=2078957 RepID=UPI00286F5EC7|nr:uncharacterized protein LOC132194077 [Neocloeon triangulifer]XP_059471124.1 uncharacterized protein LOC132194077 [Neocloeon triangulifer]XP_059471125.1 uncharacterized protein LOC132194077 [Neocloeon triangulifer]